MDADTILINAVAIFFFIFGIYCQILIKRNEKEIEETRKNNQ